MSITSKASSPIWRLNPPYIFVVGEKMTGIVYMSSISHSLKNKMFILLLVSVPLTWDVRHRPQRISQSVLDCLFMFKTKDDKMLAQLQLSESVWKALFRWNKKDIFPGSSCISRDRLYRGRLSLLPQPYHVCQTPQNRAESLFQWGFPASDDALCLRYWHFNK